jgi:hypothetical protein
VYFLSLVVVVKRRAGLRSGKPLRTNETARANASLSVRVARPSRHYTPPRKSRNEGKKEGQPSGYPLQINEM